MSARGTVRLLYVVTHPIQYQAPLLRRVAGEEGIDLTVWFVSDFSLRAYRDKGFGRSVEWDVPLVEGYRHEFLSERGQEREPTFFEPACPGVGRKLREGRFDVVWLHGYNHISQLEVLWGCLRMGIPAMLRGESHEMSGTGSGLKRVGRRLLLPVFLRSFRACLAIGSANARFYAAHGVEAGRIFRVPYAVDNEFFRARIGEAGGRREELRRELGLTEDWPVVLYASKLQERKRPDELLAAYEMLAPGDGRPPRAYLLFVGDGELRGRIEKRAGELGWPTVRMVGFRGQHELCRYYDLCDVFVLPGVHEPWGLVVNEVLNAGKAVVVSRHAGCGEDLIEEGRSGFRYTPGDVGGLSECLRRLIEDEGMRGEMGRRGLELVDRWSFREDVAGLREAIAACAGGRGWAAE